MTKEVNEILRDRLFMTLAFISPVLMMLLMGYGMNLDVENIPIVILDYDDTPASRDYAYRYVDSRYFDFKGFVTNEHELEKLIMAAKVRGGIIIPEHFGARLASGQGVEVQTLIEGVIPLRANMTKGYVIAINAYVNQENLTGFLSRLQGIPRERAADTINSIRLESRYLYNQAVKSVWSLAPKLIMLILMMTPPFLTSVSVVREKERGSILNIYASTVSRAEYIIGKLGPYAVIALFNGVLLWVLATQLFLAPFKGSFLFFLLCTSVYAICTTGLGLLVSIFVRTQIAAIVVTMMVTVVPAMLYSGILIPLSSLGTLPKLLAYLAPAMHYSMIIDGTFLKGEGFATLWIHFMNLVIYTTVLFALSYSLFTKRPKS